MSSDPASPPRTTGRARCDVAAGWAGWSFALRGPVLEAVALAGDLDDFGVMEEAVEDGSGGGTPQSFPSRA
jgi:hypothetical protein